MKTAKIIQFMVVILILLSSSASAFIDAETASEGIVADTINNIKASFSGVKTASLTTAAISTTQTVIVSNSPSNGGSTQVYKNGAYLDTVTTKSKTFNFLTSDTIGLNPMPSSGYKFVRMCDPFECINGGYTGALYPNLAIYQTTSYFVIDTSAEKQLTKISIPTDVTIETGKTKTIIATCSYSDGSSGACPSFSSGMGYVLSQTNGVVTETSSNNILSIKGLSSGTANIYFTDKTPNVQSNIATITVTSGSVSPTPTPVASTGFIDIKSTPSGASISIDGIYKGTTPKVVSMPKGDHMVKLSLTGYSDNSYSVYTEAGQTAEVQLTLMGAPQGTPKGTAGATASPTVTGTANIPDNTGGESSGTIDYDCKEGMILTENGCKYPTSGDDGGSGTPSEKSIMDNPLYIYVGLLIILVVVIVYTLSPKKVKGYKRKPK